MKTKKALNRWCRADKCPAHNKQVNSSTHVQAPWGALAWVSRAEQSRHNHTQKVRTATLNGRTAAGRGLGGLALMWDACGCCQRLERSTSQGWHPSAWITKGKDPAAFSDGTFRLRQLKNHVSFLHSSYKQQDQQPWFGCPHTHGILLHSCMWKLHRNTLQRSVYSGQEQ